jgi:signal peptidase II
LKKYLRDYTYLFVIAGIIVAFDQITKAYVRAHLEYGAVWTPWDWMLPYARIVHWYNTGVAFGMLQGYGSIFKYLAIIIAIAIIYYFPRVPRAEVVLRFALALQLAGAVGNLIDRVWVGHVTDFISVGNFAVFNIADASISVGVAILIVAILIQEQRDKKAAALAAQTGSGEVEIPPPEADEEDVSAKANPNNERIS